MEFALDLAYQNFEKKKPELERACIASNEAKTRLSVIDIILFQILDWSHANVEPEKYCRDGYADYVLSCNNCPTLIIEAKKSGVPFTTREVDFEDRPYMFGFISKECPEAAEALKQAIGYASTIGSRYVAITNGHQWLFCLTFVSGQMLGDRLIYVFESFNAISDRFRSFINCFSATCLSENKPLARLLVTLQQPPPPKFSCLIPGYPQSANRNIFKNQLAYILDYVWELMAEDEGTNEFVEHCYVNPETHADTISLVREMLSRRVTEDSQLFHYEVESASGLPHKIKQLQTQKPFVVLGEIGRGKTSFLKYLRFVAAKDLLNSYIQIDINFLDRPDKPEDVPSFVYLEVEKQLREIYSVDIHEDSFVRGVLDADILRLRGTPEGRAHLSSEAAYQEYELKEIRSLMADKHSYLMKAVRHLKKGRKNSLTIFFDNLDRRTSEIQEEAFLKASAIARDWACLVFVCLRPDTFHRSQEDGVLDSIAPIAFTVSHPDLSLVLKKRFAYAKSIAEGTQTSQHVSRMYLNRNITFELPQVAELLGACEFSAWKKRGIVPVLVAVANGNIRKMLDFSKAVLCSGHLDTQKIISKIQEGGSYSIPDFEGIKALLYGEYMQYDPTSSPFVNLFDVTHSNTMEHFICLAILRFLSGFSPDNPDAGFVQRTSLEGYLNGCGFSIDAMESAINVLIRKELLKVRADEGSKTPSFQRIRITSLGRFHLFSLPHVFQYLDAVTVDTPIMDAKIRELVQGDDNSIGARLFRTKCFLEYLDKSSQSLSDKQLKDLWSEVSKKAWQEMQFIETKLPPPQQQKAAPKAPK